MGSIRFVFLNIRDARDRGDNRVAGVVPRVASRARDTVGIGTEYLCAILLLIGTVFTAEVYA